MKLKGKKALITGSSIGIGRAIAWAYAQEGADVAIHYRSSEKEAIALRDEILETFHTKAICIKADMANDDEVKNMLDTTMRELGGIDILVCNAGIDQKISVMDMTMEDFDKMIHVDLRSVVLCNKLVLPHMLEKGFGRIINVTSQLG